MCHWEELRMYMATPIIQSGIPDVSNTAKEPDTKWERVAVAFARMMALQIPEWIKLKALKVKVFWKIIKVKRDSGSGIPVFAVYFYVPGYELGMLEDEPTLDGKTVTEITLTTIRK